MFQEDLSAIIVENKWEGEEQQGSKIVQRKKHDVQIISGTSQNKVYKSLATSDYSSPVKCRPVINVHSTNLLRAHNVHNSQQQVLANILCQVIRQGHLYLVMPISSHLVGMWIAQITERSSKNHSKNKSESRKGSKAEKSLFIHQMLVLYLLYERHSDYILSQKWILIPEYEVPLVRTIPTTTKCT